MMMKKLFLVLIMVVASGGIISAQTKKTDTVYVKSSVVCGMCKERIEGALAFEPGIKDVKVDLDKKEVVVVYNTKKKTPDAIRKTLSELGYDADDVKADKEAYEKLPPCCKKGNEKH